MKNVTAAILVLGLLYSMPSQSQHETVATDKAPAAIGPYSQAVRVGDMLFVSGQLPIDLTTNEILDGDIADQTKLALTHIESILEEAGFSLLDVVKSDVFLQNLSDFAAMNSVYASFFGSNPPARSTVEVAKVPKGALVEIAVIAMKINE